MGAAVRENGRELARKGGSGSRRVAFIVPGVGDAVVPEPAALMLTPTVQEPAGKAADEDKDENTEAVRPRLSPGNRNRSLTQILNPVIIPYVFPRPPPM